MGNRAASSRPRRRLAPGDKVRIERFILEPWGWPVRPAPKDGLEHVSVASGTEGVVVEVSYAGITVDHLDRSGSPRRTLFEHQYVAMQEVQ